MKKSIRIYEYDMLRVVTTLLVVIGHGGYYLIDTPFGGCDYSAFVDSKIFSWRIITIIISFIYSFHMPLFMALGGALFNLSISRIGNMRDLLLSKAKRLLIPFLVVSICFCFPIKYVTGYFRFSESILIDFLVGQLLIQGNTHLWYLVGMFFVFIEVYALEHYTKLSVKHKLFFLICLSLISKYINLNIISYPLQYGFWFYLGFCFEPIREKIKSIISIKTITVLIICALIVYCGYRFFDEHNGLYYEILEICIHIVFICMALICAYMFSYLLSNTKIADMKLYKVIARNTFGIYLFSDPVNYLILAAAGANGEQYFSNNLGVITLFLIRVIGTLIISLIIAEILRKFKVKYLV